jgi:ABC-2 type transport system permease protein
MIFLRSYFATFGEIAHDRPATLILLLSIVLYSAFYPTAYMHQVTVRVPLAICDLDNSYLSRKLQMAAAATQGVEVTAHPGSMAEAKMLLESERVEAVLWIAPGFERDTLRGAQGQAAILANGAYLIRTRAALTALSGALGDTVRTSVKMNLAGQGVPPALPAELIVRPMFNTREGYGSAIVPAGVALIGQQPLVLGIGLLLATWRGASRRKAQGAAFFGSASAFFTIGMCSLLYFCGFTFWVQDYPHNGNTPALFVMGPLFVASVVAMGLFLGSFYTRREQSGQFLLGTSLPFFFLSCVTWPISAVPPALLWFAKLFPAPIAMQAVVKLTQMGATLGEIEPELVDFAVLALVYGIAAWVRLCAPADLRLFGRRNAT